MAGVYTLNQFFVRFGEYNLLSVIYIVEAVHVNGKYEPPVSDFLKNYDYQSFLPETNVPACIPPLSCVLIYPPI